LPGSPNLPPDKDRAQASDNPRRFKTQLPDRAKRRRPARRKHSVSINRGARAEEFDANQTDRGSDRRRRLSRKAAGTFQPFGQIWIMNADGSGKIMLTDGLWEDSMPFYLPGRN
jgi:hypothetical protein